MNVTEKAKPIIGFVGTGVMGSSMVKNLQAANYTVNIYTRTKARAKPLLEGGAIWKETVAELASSSDVVITMVGYPEDVEAIYFGEEGMIHHAKQGTYLVDMTTSSPVLAEEIFKEAKHHEIYALDAPVSGGDVGAKNGTLTIMVGGDEEAFTALLPIFQVLGENVILQGKAGAGQHTKLANQITIATNMIGVCEAIIYAKHAGLDPSRMLDSIEAGAAGSWSLSNLGRRMIKGDYAPGFFVKHFIKDMKIAIEVAEKMGINTPGLKLSLELYEQLAAMGESDSGTQALIKLLEKHSE